MEHIENMLEKGIARRSKSPYTSPAFLVGRPGQEPRMVIDYRANNPVADSLSRMFEEPNDSGNAEMKAELQDRDIKCEVCLRAKPARESPKFVWMAPLRVATSNSVVDALNATLFRSFGYPHILVSDNASQLTSKIFEDMCFNNGIKHVTTTPYYPQPSHVEKFHWNLKATLIGFHHVHHKDWDKNLMPLQIAFNSAVHDSHRKTPTSLMLGHDLLSPIKLRWEIRLGTLEDQSDRYIEVEWGEALCQLKKHRARYDAGRYPVSYKVRDKVVYELHNYNKAIDGKTAKFDYRWSAPTIISKFLTPVTVQLMDPVTGLATRRAHVT
uniref:Integrase catalytic domain-containing protein n=1 Tax=Timema poppense TaxID=170557 RepID=A0A7R9CUF3_TIMPO|nr:unnamed protein product [Timema poppensis]